MEPLPLPRLGVVPASVRDSYSSDNVETGLGSPIFSPPLYCYNNSNNDSFY